ncbi:unnamed protein product, partial [Iphiclides podalirius]
MGHPRVFRNSEERFRWERRRSRVKEEAAWEPARGSQVAGIITDATLPAHAQPIGVHRAFLISHPPTCAANKQMSSNRRNEGGEGGGGGDKGVAWRPRDSIKVLH